MSTSVLRRYTPPTCTLEIAATGSVLSRWTDRTVLKNLRFQLSFDDPKLPPDQQVTIRGDRTQLEALCEVVETYVQSLLNQSPEQAFSLSSASSLNSSSLNSSINSSDLNPSPHLKLVYSDASLTALTEGNPATPHGSAHSVAGISLQPKGALSHDLYLGSLAADEGSSIVHLSALQLFDLANALDDYHTEALTLPTLNRPAWLKSSPGWARAAAVLLFAVGVTGAVTKFVMDISSPVPQEVAATNREVDINATQRSDIASRLPVPAPPGSSPSDADLKLQSPFPPKPPAGALQPEASADPSAAELPPVGVTAVPVDQLPLSQAPSQPLEDPTVNSPPANDVMIVPSDGASTVAQAPSIDALTEIPAPDGLSSSTAIVQPLTAESEAATGARTAPSASTFDGSTTQSDTQVAATSSTAFDTFPQVAEIRNYFQQNWQPPEEMGQTIEYRLVLNADGSIQQIIPLGDASGRFVDRTNMPLMGEPFVSPLEGRSVLQVRLVLNPDGRVQAFADGNQ